MNTFEGEPGQGTSPGRQYGGISGRFNESDMVPPSSPTRSTPFLPFAAYCEKCICIYTPHVHPGLCRLLCSLFFILKRLQILTKKKESPKVKVGGRKNCCCDRNSSRLSPCTSSSAPLPSIMNPNWIYSGVIFPHRELWSVLGRRASSPHNVDTFVCLFFFFFPFLLPHTSLTLNVNRRKSKKRT